MINQIEFYSFPHDDHGRYDQVIMKLLYSFVGTSAHWLLGFSGGRRRQELHYHNRYFVDFRRNGLVCVCAAFAPLQDFAHLYNKTSSEQLEIQTK